MFKKLIYSISFAVLIIFSITILSSNSGSAADSYQIYSLSMMETGLKFYSSKDGVNMVYVGYIACWFKDSDPVTFRIKMAKGGYQVISRKDIKYKKKWYVNKNDPAFNNPDNKNYNFKYCQ